MLKTYETTIIFTPVLQDGEVKEVIGKYRESLSSFGGDIKHEDFWGLRQLAYPIQRKTTGIYLVLEYTGDQDTVAKLELTMKRDEANVLRFLTTRLDKFALEYNENKRKGLVGANKKAAADNGGGDA